MKAIVTANATLALTVLALLAGGCQEAPVEAVLPEPPINKPGEVPSEVSGIRLVAAECRGNLQQLKVDCQLPATLPAGISPDIIVGGQNHYLTLTSSNVNYSAGTQQFTFDVTLRNRIAQPMGTTDANTLTLDPSGIKVFFHTGPVVTSGTGTISVIGDGTATFTQADQPYYQYNNVLQTFQATPTKTWTLLMPSTVTTFSFTALVSAPVPWPEGYIDISGPNSLRYDERQYVATVRTAVGDPVSSMPITWASSDTTRAPIGAADGMAKPMRAGIVTLSAASVLNGNPVSGTILVTVNPIRRIWTAGAGTTDWGTNENWSPAVRPQPTDTVEVPVNGVNTYPMLTQNESVGGVIVADNASFNITTFNLTASGDVTTGLNGGIAGTSGHVLLTGSNRVVGGVLPRVRVSGTYSLNSNLTVTGPLRADLGRIRNTSFRLRVNP